MQPYSPKIVLITEILASQSMCLRENMFDANTKAKLVTWASPSDGEVGRLNSYKTTNMYHDLPTTKLNYLKEM